MTISQLAEKMSLTALVPPGNPDAPVLDCYIGDLLSWVMGRAPEGSLWLTVMGNVNAVAVAKLADLSAIVLCENAPLDGEARAQAQNNGIAVYTSPHSSCRLAVEAAGLLGLGEKLH